MPDHPHTKYLQAVFAATATAFLSMGLSIELENEFLPVAFAAEILAVAWINTRIPIPALRLICMALALAFGLLLAP